MKPFNWIPLTRWQRLKRTFNHYWNPWRRCVVCNRRFYNPDWWRLYSLQWGIPEHCSSDCANEEMDELTNA